MPTKKRAKKRRLRDTSEWLYVTDAEPLDVGSESLRTDNMQSYVDERVKTVFVEPLMKVLHAYGEVLLEQKAVTVSWINVLKALATPETRPP